MEPHKKIGSKGGNRSTNPDLIYPPQPVLTALQSAQHVHPIYPLAKFCKINQSDLKPHRSALKDMISAVDRRITGGVASQWLERRNSWLQKWQSLGLVRWLTLKTESRTALWLSFPGPTELGICLHHIYGVPYLPSSALKGLASSAMWRDLAPQAEEPPPEVTELFGVGGNLGHIGLVDFLDGIPLSESDILTLEVMTVHHMKYYSGETLYPHDCEGPNPVVFPVIKPGVEFEVALLCTRPEFAKDVIGLTPQEVLDQAARYLCLGLQQMGLGAKTTSGFGRFTCLRVQASQPKHPKADTPGVEVTRRTEEQEEQKVVEPPKPKIIEVVAQVTLVEPNKQKAEAVTSDGQKLEFNPLLFVQKANIYRPDWRKQVGQQFIFTLEDGNVINLRKKEG